MLPDSDFQLQTELQRLIDARRHEWPRRAFEHVVDGLRSQSRQTRALALRLAPRDVYDSVARELLALLDTRADDDAERLEVITAIEGMVARGVAFDFDVHPITLLEIKGRLSKCPNTWWRSRNDHIARLEREVPRAE